MKPTWTVTVRGTHRKEDYVKGYAITGTDGRYRDIYFGRGYHGDRPVLDRGAKISVQLEEGKWITALSVANGNVPRDVTAVARRVGMEPVAFENEGSFPNTPEQQPQPATVQPVAPPAVQAAPPVDEVAMRVAYAVLAVVYPHASQEDRKKLAGGVKQALSEFEKVSREV